MVYTDSGTIWKIMDDIIPREPGAKKPAIPSVQSPTACDQICQLAERNRYFKVFRLLYLVLKFSKKKDCYDLKNFWSTTWCVTPVLNTRSQTLSRAFHNIGQVAIIGRTTQIQNNATYCGVTKAWSIRKIEFQAIVAASHNSKLNVNAEIIPWFIPPPMIIHQSYFFRAW